MQANVLIVEDDALCAKWIRHILEHVGCVITCASDGEEALRILRQATFDVAILDLKLPKTDGFEVLKWIRESAPGIVSIVLSGTQSVSDALRAVQEGAYDFLSKPLDSADVLLRRVEHAIEHKRLRESRDGLLQELQDKNVELENRLGQLEMAHSIVKSQAVALQADLNRAMRIQQGLLPRQSPFPNKTSFSAFFHPMAKVGGDLYDIVKLDSQRIGFYIADASGHGVSSAMLTVFLKHAVQGAVRDPESGALRTPGEMMGALNETLITEAFGQGVFVSLTYGILDTATGQVAYSNAGHPPWLLKRSGGGVERLHRASPVLGVNPKVIYTHGDFVMRPGDMLVMYSDGISEARNAAGETFTVDRLRQLIEDTESHTDAIVQAAEAALQDFRGTARSADDETLAVLGIEPQREVAAPCEPAIEPAPTGVGAKVLTAERDGMQFVSLTGAGSWRESQNVLDLCTMARERGFRAIVFDLGHCTHLDSTFLGVLHNIATSFDAEQNGTPHCRFEVQNVPRTLLRDMSELGLTSVLLHFRPEPLALPASMRPLEGGPPEGEEMGRLLLWAHESLVDADPSNADRFAAVLEVLHARAIDGQSAT